MYKRFLFLHSSAVVLFIIVVSINFSKPFGFFRESNPAMVCINTLLWQQYPQLKKSHVPVVSYAFNVNSTARTELYNTSTTFGYGWFIVPYYYFTFLHLPPTEINIRWFSLFWLILTLYSINALTRELTLTHKEGVLIRCLTLLFYVFNASALWYHVQGYVHEVPVLPFYFLSWMFFSRYLRSSKKTSGGYLLLLAITLCIAIQFDWLPVFQGGVMAIYLLLKRKILTHTFAFAIPLVSLAIGLIWIIYTYSAWATLPVYVEHLKIKFLNRTVGGGGLQIFSWLNYNFNIIVFYVSGYGLLIALFIYGLIKLKKHSIVWLMVISALFHHLIFWGFSTEHDHGVLKMALPIAFVSALIVAGLSNAKRLGLSLIIIALNIGLYFFLHNYFTRPGMYANPRFCYELGKVIKTNIPSAGNYIFINTEGKYFPQIEFYSGRYYILANSVADAKEILHKDYPGGNGFYIEAESKLKYRLVSFQ